MKKLFFLLSLVLMFFPMGVFACGEENEANMMGWNWGTGGGMMGGGYFGIIVFFVWLTWVVWLTVGVLTIIWLWKKINKK